MREARTPPGVTPVVESLIGEAEQSDRQLRRADARERYETALHLGALGDTASAALLIRRIARTFIDEAEFDAALDCLEAALACAYANHDAAGLAHATNLMGIAHQGLGNLDEAADLYASAHATATECGDQPLIGMVQQNLGTIAAIRGETKEAMRFYRLSLATYRRAGLDYNAAQLFNNLGMLHADLRRWDAAAHAYDQAMTLFATHNDVGGQFGITVNKAALCISRGDLGRARELCDSVLELTKAHPGAPWIGEAHKHVGVLYREAGDQNGAELHLRVAQRIAHARRDLLLAAETAREHAEVCWRVGRHHDMLQHLNVAHRAFSRLRASRNLADVERLTTQLESRFLQLVRTWGDSIESKDRYTQGHCERVAEIACRLARAAGLDERALFWFRVGALLHDVGKLIVPSEVLNKPSRLTQQEWALMRRHPVAGVELLDGIDFPWDVRPMVRHHHERWDGAGYPDGLAGEAIPFAARVLCIADVYDALTTARSYRDAIPHRHALEIMSGERAGLFDPRLVDLFVQEVAQSLIGESLPQAPADVAA